MKVDYYLARTKEKLEKAGITLDDAIKVHNQVANRLNEATNMFRLAVGSMDLKLCHRCTKDAKYNKNGIEFCEEHWKIEEKEAKELEEKKLAKKKRQAENRGGK